MFLALVFDGHPMFSRNYVYQLERCPEQISSNVSVQDFESLFAYKKEVTLVI